MRSALRDAEVQPSEGGWERLRRELDAAEESARRPVAPMARKSMWRIHGPRVAAAAAVVLVCIVAVELLWHPERELAEMEAPYMASTTLRSDAVEDPSPVYAASEEASALSPEARTRQAESPEQRSAVAQSDAGSLRERLAAATGLDRTEAVVGNSGTSRGESSRQMLLARRSEPLDETRTPDPAAGKIPSAGSAEDVAAVGQERAAEKRAAADGRERAATKGAAANGSERTSSAETSPSPETADVAGTSSSETGRTALQTANASSETASGAERTSLRSGKEHAREGSVRKASAVSTPADPFADPFAGERPRRSRTSLSLFAGGGMSGSGGSQPAALMSSSVITNDAVSVIGNGNNFSSIRQRNNYDESSFRHHLPLSFGLTLRKELPYGLSLESGVVYTFLRSDVRLRYSSDDISQKLHFLGIPLRLNWQFVERGPVSAYLGAGVMAEKCVSAKFGSEAVNESAIQWSALAAIGIQYRLADYVGLYFEPEVSGYFTETQLRTSRTDAPLTLTLRLGVRVLF